MGLGIMDDQAIVRDLIKVVKKGSRGEGVKGVVCGGR
jgi:hypothetical protein